MAIYGELGLLPIGIDVLICVHKYKEHIKSTLPDTLLGLAKSECLKTSYITWWQKLVNHAMIINGKQLLPVQLKGIYKQLFTDKWLNSINDVNSKLYLYSKIKSHLQFENYLCDIKIGQHRAAFTKLRTSSHNLSIETGRYARPKIPKEERLCTECKVIENEQHFLLKCSRFNDERFHLFQKVSDLCPNFPTLSDPDKFIYLMTAEKKVACETAKFCYLSFEKRKSIIYPN